MTVPAHDSLVTLGVTDLVRSTPFYVGLGWQPSPAPSDEITFLRTSGVAYNPGFPLDADGRIQLRRPRAARRREITVA